MIRIESPKSESDLREFVGFYDTVYAQRSARWPAPDDVQLGTLLGAAPFARDRKFLPLLARDDARILARAVAMVDQRYIEHWDEPLGHICLFEALPGAVEATRKLVDEACSWLRGQGMKAARTGFAPAFLEFPYVIDDYETLPPRMLRHNPAYYHSLLKDAGFETEKGSVDYKIEVTPELVSRYESAVKGGEVAGFELVPLRDVAEDRRARDFTATWNEAFEAHWGQPPFIADEFAGMFMAYEPAGVLDTSLLAYQGGEIAGVLLVVPAAMDDVLVAPGRKVHDSERLNILGIGVLAPFRGRGLNMAMASYAFLECIRRGQTHLSYTWVLDDNWPSRRTGENLGASVCANYNVYRRALLR